MSNSLKSELLRLGFPDTQVKKAKKPKKSGHKKTAHKNSIASIQSETIKAQTTDFDTLAKELNQSQASIISSDIKLQQQKECKKQKKELREKIKTLLRENQLNEPDADLAYHFPINKQIKRIYLTSTQRDDIIAAKTAIVVRGDAHYLVDLTTLQEVKTLKNDTVYFLASEHGSQDDDNTDDHRIPDDMVW